MQAHLTMLYRLIAAAHVNGIAHIDTPVIMTWNRVSYIPGLAAIVWAGQIIKLLLIIQNA